MRYKQLIPNGITLLNLICGCLAVLSAVKGYFLTTAFFVVLGIIFDFFDGFLARKLNVQSAVGIQLDSLADMITSGLVPGIIIYKLLLISGLLSENLILQTDWNTPLFNAYFGSYPLAFIGFIITLSSAYRLAKFNIDEDQQTYFKGLPTPANALMILSLPLIMQFQNNPAINNIILNPWFLIIVAIVSAWLLNSNIKLFTLKFSSYTLKGNTLRYGFLLLCLFLLILFKFLAVPLIIISYIILSVLFFRPLTK